MENIKRMPMALYVLVMNVLLSLGKPELVILYVAEVSKKK
jgi:hypothetical protein